LSIFFVMRGSSRTAQIGDAGMPHMGYQHPLDSNQRRQGCWKLPIGLGQNRAVGSLLYGEETCSWKV
jgi:hypothetical protein